MVNLTMGTVTARYRSEGGIDHVEVAVEPDGTRRRAIGYTELSGNIKTGDRVLLNTTAVDLGLGTGGWDFVVANVSAAERHPVRYAGRETAGHLMKLRYTPMQLAVEAAEESGDALRDTLDGRPVVVAELHSQLAPIVAGLALGGARRVAYVVPDTAALPVALSDTVRELRTKGLIGTVVTCGQAFGGEYEAVNLTTGLLVAAWRAGCDAVVVAQGPGQAGTATPFGFGGVYQADAIHSIRALDGVPVLAPRVSRGDPRTRHRGISHHTWTVLERLLLTPVAVAWPGPTGVDDALDAWIEGLRVELADRCTRARAGHGISMAPGDLLYSRLNESDLPLESMGRRFGDDPGFFLPACAAGYVAAAGRTVPSASVREETE